MSSRGPSTSTVAFLWLVAAWFAGAARAEDWPQFRGVHRDGRSAETGLLERWPESGPQAEWRVPLGEGFSSVAVVGDRLYTMWSDPTGEDEVVGCLDSASGKTIWTRGVGRKFKERHGNGPRSTPTVDRDAVFVLGSYGKLMALDAATGEDRWSHDLGDEFGARVPKWGMAASLLVDGSRVLVPVGGRNGTTLMAFDRESGEELWRWGERKVTYSSPILIEVGGERQVVLGIADEIVGVSPADGTLLWRHSWLVPYNVNTSTPIFVEPDRVFFSSGYDKGAAMFRVGGGDEGVPLERLWQTRTMKNQFHDSVLHDGYLYGFDNKNLKCISVETGALVWRARGLGHGSLIYSDGHLIMLGEEGQLVLAEATPQDYREKSRAQVLEGKTWTMPTLSRGRLFVRNETELLALKVDE